MDLAHQPLLIGVWIGLVHAFDADHISTIGTLAVRGRSNSVFSYATRWACGHAVAIGVLGVLAIGVGMLWVSTLSRFAEMLVATLLIVLGINTIVSTLKRYMGPGLVASSPHSAAANSPAGLLMGLLHGGAGSAAVLAILPLAGLETGRAAVGFLTMFSFGVAAGALLFAAIFSRLLLRANRKGEHLVLAVAGVVGVIAITVGGSMLLGTFGAG